VAPLLEPISSDELRGIICTQAAPVVVAYVDKKCPVCQSYVPVFREFALSYNGDAVFVVAWIHRVPEEALRIGLSVVPTTVVYKDCRPMVALPGFAHPEELKALIEKALPEALRREEN